MINSSHNTCDNATSGGLGEQHHTVVPMRVSFSCFVIMVGFQETVLWTRLLGYVMLTMLAGLFGGCAFFLRVCLNSFG
jgi:hypothetical protein